MKTAILGDAAKWDEAIQGKWKAIEAGMFFEEGECVEYASYYPPTPWSNRRPVEATLDGFVYVTSKGRMYDCTIGTHAFKGNGMKGFSGNA